MVLIALDVVAVILELVVHDLYCPCADRYTEKWDTLAYGSPKPHPWHSWSLRIWVRVRPPPRWHGLR